MNRTCDNLRADLSAYLDGELGPEDRRRIEAHLDGCARCRRVLERWERIGSTMAGFYAVPWQAGSLSERVLDRVRGEAVPRGNVVPWFALPAFRWAAVLVAVLCGVVAAWLALPGRPGGYVVVVGHGEPPAGLPEKGGPMYVVESIVPMAAPAAEESPTPRDGLGHGYRWAADEIDAARVLRSGASLADGDDAASVTALETRKPAMSDEEEILLRDKPDVGGLGSRSFFDLDLAESPASSPVTRGEKTETAFAREADMSAAAGTDLFLARPAGGEVSPPRAEGTAAASAGSGPGFPDADGDPRSSTARFTPGLAGEPMKEEAVDTAMEGRQPPGRLRFVAIDADWARNYTQTVAHDLDGEVLAAGADVCPPGIEGGIGVLLPADNVERFVFELEANNVRVVDWQSPGDPDAEDLRAEGLLPPLEPRASVSGLVAAIDPMAALKRERSPAPGGIPARSGGVIRRSLDAGDRDGPGRPRLLHPYCIEIEGVGKPAAGAAGVH